MPYSDAPANAANDALMSTIATVEFYTAAYASLLGSTAITFAASVVSAGLSTATANSLPIADTWDANGTVDSVKFLNGSSVVVLQRSDALAVTAAGGGGMVQLSSLSAVSGGAYNITSAAHSFNTLLEGEV